METKKPSKEKRIAACRNCGALFGTHRPKAEFCGSRCRVACWHKTESDTALLEWLANNPHCKLTGLSGGDWIVFENYDAPAEREIGVGTNFRDAIKNAIKATQQ